MAGRLTSKLLTRGENFVKPAISVENIAVFVSVELCFRVSKIVL